MGVRTRGLDIKAGAANLKADRAAREEAEAVIDRWNRRLATGRDMLWSPTIRAALLAGTPWLDVFCPGCGTSRAIDLRALDRHPLASVGTLVWACGARGVRGRRRCRSCWARTPSRRLTGRAPRYEDAQGWFRSDRSWDRVRESSALQSDTVYLKVAERWPQPLRHHAGGHIATIRNVRRVAHLASGKPRLSHLRISISIAASDGDAFRDYEGAGLL
jgi:hypothetical protein